MTRSVEIDQKIAENFQSTIVNAMFEMKLQKVTNVELVDSQKLTDWKKIDLHHH